MPLFDSIQSHFHYIFKNERLLEQALSHPSTVFQRMEFLGDRVLSLSLSHWLYETYSQEKEGNLAKCLAVLASRSSLEDCGRRLGLVQKEHSRILSDTVEALLGAVYLDGGFSAAAAVVRKMWAPLFSSMSVCDAKTDLQEYLQALGAPLPVYRVLDQKGPSHNPIFSIEVCCKNGDFFSAKGASKKQAEQNAAQKALIHYQTSEKIK